MEEKLSVKKVWRGSSSIPSLYKGYVLKDINNIIINLPMASLVFMIFFFLCISVSSSSSSSSSGVCKFPLKDGAEVNGMFVFGSSLVDNGNNNFLKTTARADFLPYGNDFPTGPSGRFTNGKNLIDCLGEHLKIPFAIPPFKHPSTKGDRILHGVNFASAGSGILNETGSLSGTVMNFNEQIKNFEEVILPQLKAQLCNSSSTPGGGTVGSSSSKSSELTTFDTILSDYLFVLGVGGNDYLLNYFVVPTSKYKLVSIPQFTDILISSLSAKIKKLYSLGGRKFVLPTIYPIGCIPEVKSLGEMLKSKNDHRGCLDLVNGAARGYNTQLKSLLDELKKKLPGINFVYIDSYKTIYDIIQNPASQGFKDVSNACCQQVPSLLEGGNGLLCKKGSSSCKDRKSQLFFDALHPTEAVNVLIAKQAYQGSKTDVYPFNVQQLIKSS